MKWSWHSRRRVFSLRRPWRGTDNRRGRYVGPGHSGLLDLGSGVQKCSCHYEADMDCGGISVLDIRPLLWRDRRQETADVRRGNNGSGPSVTERRPDGSLTHW
jgi:hypothetical protein